MVKIFSHSKVTLHKKCLLSKNGLRIAPRVLVKVLEKFFFLTTITFPKNGLRITPRALVKVLEKFFFDHDYFPKMASEFLQEP